MTFVPLKIYTVTKSWLIHFKVIVVVYRGKITKLASLSKDLQTKRFSARRKSGIHTAGVALLLSPGWPESQKQHDFQSCWVLTLPEDARCSCSLQLFTFIYNVCPSAQDSSLRVHRHMHNLEQIPWKQTSQSTTTGDVFLRKSCWWQHCGNKNFSELKMYKENSIRGSDSNSLLIASTKTRTQKAMLEPSYRNNLVFTK